MEDMPTGAWHRFVDAFFNPEVNAQYLPAIAKGFVLTVELALLVVLSGILLGLLLAILRCMGWRAINFLLVAVVDVLRALPPLVLILLVYFGLPSLGLSLSGFVTVWLVLTLILAAFAEEIFWAGITSVDRGQWQAARSTGLGHMQALLHVILPQAVRMTVAPLTNRTIAISKNTALGTVVGVGEILNQATTATSFAGNASPLMLGAIAYLLLFVPVVVIGRWIETRFAWQR